MEFRKERVMLNGTETEISRWNCCRTQGLSKDQAKALMRAKEHLRTADHRATMKSMARKATLRR